jgi:hypothetical protein
MLRKTMFLAVTATILTLLSTGDAKAWRAAHVGYTHVGPNGVQHWGRTAAAGPGGAYAGGSRYASYGGYHAGYGGAYGGAYHYGAGYGGEAYGGYRAGYYRRW